MIPSTIPMAAPVIMPRMVTLEMEGVLPTNKKPATAMHKVHRVIRMLMVYSKRQRAAPIANGNTCTAKEGNFSIG